MKSEEGNLLKSFREEYGKLPEEVKKSIQLTQVNEMVAQLNENWVQVPPIIRVRVKKAVRLMKRINNGNTVISRD